MSKENTILEVEILLSQSVIDSNPEISKVYDAKKKSIKYEISNSIPKEFSDKLSEIMPEFKGADIVQFNPLIAAVNELQEIKMLIPDADDYKASERILIDNNKIIGSFNSSLTKAKKIIKQPHVDYNKKVDELFKLFENESVNTRNSLENNFKEVIEEKERVKKEKEDKKKAEELEQINKLSEENTEMAAKIKNQEFDSAKSKIESGLNAMVSNVVSKIEGLNTDGLTALLTAIKNVNKTMYVSLQYDELLGKELIQEYYDIFEKNKNTCAKLISSAISSIQMNQELEKRKLVEEAKASSPDVLREQQNTPIAPQPQQVAEEVKPEPSNDLEKFQFIADFNNNFIADYKAGVEKIKAISFEHPDLNKLRDALIEKQYPNMIEWLDKLADYTTKKNEFIINNLK